MNDDEFYRVGKVKYDRIKKYGIATLETQWKTKQGKMIDVLLSTTYIDKKNPCLGATFSALDITEKKKIENELEDILGKRIDDWKNEVSNNDIGHYEKLINIIED